MSIVTLTLQWGPITRPELMAKSKMRPASNGTGDEEQESDPPAEPEALENGDGNPFTSSQVAAPQQFIYDYGWRGQINGLTVPEREQFLKALPISGVGRPSEVPDAGAGISSKLVMDHLHNSGEVSREEMPMDFVFEYLKILVQMNYRVVASHSQTVNSNEHCSSAAVWTLQKDENRSPLVNALGGLIL